MAKQHSAAADEPALEDGSKLEIRPAIAPPEGKRFFLVSWTGDTDPKKVTANDENEAWALYCDGVKKWPPPASRSIMEINSKGEPLKPDSQLVKGEAAKAQSEATFTRLQAEAAAKAEAAEKAKADAKAAAATK